VAVGLSMIAFEIELWSSWKSVHDISISTVMVLAPAHHVNFPDRIRYVLLYTVLMIHNLEIRPVPYAGAL
jgi:hypothetical protein